MGLIEIGTLWLSIVIVVFLHELGHIPERIKWIRFFPIPTAAAMQARWREGGLFVNVILFIVIFNYKPESSLLLLIGAVAWLHFIIYSIVGTLIPEPKSSQVNLKTYVWDDVANELWYLFVPAAIIVYFMFKAFYLPILTGVFVW